MKSLNRVFSCSCMTLFPDAERKSHSQTWLAAQRVQVSAVSAKREKIVLRRYGSFAVHGGERTAALHAEGMQKVRQLDHCSALVSSLFSDHAIDVQAHRPSRPGELRQQPSRYAQGRRPRRRCLLARTADRDVGSRRNRRMDLVQVEGTSLAISPGQRESNSKAPTMVAASTTRVSEVFPPCNNDVTHDGHPSCQADWLPKLHLVMQIERRASAARTRLSVLSSNGLQLHGE